MKKNILATVLLSGLALSVFATTSSAAQVETSKVEVNLNKDEGHENGSGPFKDKLSIVHKPTIFKFSGDTTDGALNLDNENANADNQYISVNDDRKVQTGTEAGNFIKGAWKLEGQLSTLVDGSNTLPAKMNFDTEAGGGLLSYDIGDLQVVNGVEDYAPATIADGTAAATAADLAKYTLAKTFTLEAGATSGTPFLSAAASANSVDPETATPADLVRGAAVNLGKVKLAIATGDAQTAGAYEGTITWTLSPA